MRKIFAITTLLVGMLAAILPSRPADAVPITFVCVPMDPPDPLSCATASAGALLDVSAVGSLAHFKYTFSLVGSITDVFVSGSNALALGSLSTIANSVGVDFSIGNSSPPCLPGAPPGFSCIPALQDDSNAPTAPNGVNGPAEFVDFVYQMPTGVGLPDVLAALQDGSIRIGLHIQALPGGVSVSLINLPPEERHEISAPPSMLLLAFAVPAFMVVRRRRHP